MTRLALAALVVSLVVVACGGGSSGDTATTPSAEADALRDQIVAAMDGVTSYRADIELGREFVIEYGEPDRYRTLVVANDNQTGEPTLGEQLYVGDTIYARKCAPDGSACGTWDTTDRGDVVVGAASPSYYPHWPIVAVELADDVSISDGVLRGTVNHIRAVVESADRLTPGSTLEQDLADQEPGTSFYDEHPARIEVEYDPETYVVERFAITIIEENEDAELGDQVVEPKTFTFAYSNFDEITIEAPE